MEPRKRNDNEKIIYNILVFPKEYFYPDPNSGHKRWNSVPGIQLNGVRQQKIIEQNEGNKIKDDKVLKKFVKDSFELGARIRIMSNRSKATGIYEIKHVSSYGKTLKQKFPMITEVDITGDNQEQTQNANQISYFEDDSIASENLNQISILNYQRTSDNEHYDNVSDTISICSTSFGATLDDRIPLLGNTDDRTGRNTGIYVVNGCLPFGPMICHFNSTKCARFEILKKFFSPVGKCLKRCVTECASAMI